MRASSNERVDVLRALEPRVSVHFTRVSVRRMGLDDEGSAQFDYEPMLAGAQLLAEAEPRMIAWNGTSAPGSASARDREELCRLIKEQHRCPGHHIDPGARRCARRRRCAALQTAVPYTEDVADKMVATVAERGLQSVGGGNLGLSRNFNFDLVQPDRLERLVTDAAQNANGVAVVCTRSACRAARRETGITPASARDRQCHHGTPLEDARCLARRYPAAGIRGTSR